MDLDIFEALSDGFERTVQKNGLMLAGLYFIVSLVRTSSSQTFLQGLDILNGVSASMITTLTLPLSMELSGAIMAVSSIGSLLLSIVAIRTFVSDEKEVIPSEFYSSNLVMPTLNLILGGFLFALIITAGFIALIIPGLFLLTALYFWNVFVAVEDENFIDAMKSSWNLTDGNRLKLFALGFTVVVATGVISNLLAFPSWFGMNLAGTLLSQIGGAFTAVFTIATTAQVYNQLK